MSKTRRRQVGGVEVTQHNDMVTEIRSADDVKLLLASDLHLDHPNTDQKRVFAMFDAAVAQGAKILLNGDTLCVMQGRNDKRSSKSSIRPEHLHADYFGNLVDEIAGKLAKYAPHIIYVGEGNHETAVLKNNEIDLTRLLVDKLNLSAGTSIIRGGYHGYIIVSMTCKDGSSTRKHIIYHHHGKYGGEVTKGVLGVNRHAVVVPDADTIWTGHTHTGWLVMQPRMVLKGNHEVVTRNQYHVKSGTAKQDFNQPGGWTVERIAAPPTMIAWLMDLRYYQSGIEVNFNHVNI